MRSTILPRSGVLTRDPDNPATARSSVHHYQRSSPRWRTLSAVDRILTNGFLAAFIASLLHNIDPASQDGSKHKLIESGGFELFSTGATFVTQYVPPTLRELGSWTDDFAKG